MTHRSVPIILVCLFLLGSLSAGRAAHAASCPTLINVHIVDADTAFVGGNMPSLLKTTDRGKTWTTLDPGIDTLITKVYFLEDGLTGFAAGIDGELVRTGDGGLTWTPVDRGSEAMIADMVFPTSTTGYAVGDAGKVWKTTDTGRTWTALDTGKQAAFFSVAFTDEHTGFIGGENGRLMKTSDGGSTWLDHSLPEQGNVFSLFLEPGKTRGLAALGTGFIFVTKDAGVTWTRTTAPGAAQLSGTWLAPDSLTGFAAGAGGLILESGDGGETWTPMDTGFDKDIYSLAFSPDGHTGYAVGTDGFLGLYESETGWRTYDVSQIPGVDCYEPASLPESANPDCNPDSQAFQTKTPLQGPEGMVLLEDTGDSPETAIIICFAPDHGAGVKVEYSYLGFVLGPDFRTYGMEQSLITPDSGGIYDLMEITMPDGSSRKFYFEISDFFSR